MEDNNKSIAVAKLINEVAVLLKHNMVKNFESLGITMPQGMVLGTLTRFGQMKLTELSDRIGLSNSTVSGIIDRLERQQYVERVRSQEDRRVVYVRLTERFNDLHQDCFKGGEKGTGRILESASAEELNKIMEGLNTLKRLLEANK